MYDVLFIRAQPWTRKCDFRRNELHNNSDKLGWTLRRGGKWRHQNFPSQANNTDSRRLVVLAGTEIKITSVVNDRHQRNRRLNPYKYERLLI